MFWGVHYILLSAHGAEALLGSSVIERVKKHRGDMRRGENSGGKTPEQEARSNMHKTCQDIMSVVVCLVLMVLYGLGMWELRSTRADRVSGRSVPTQAGLYLHCGFTVYEASLYVVLGNDEGALMYVHHFGVLFNYAWVLLAGGTHFWGAWLGVSAKERRLGALLSSSAAQVIASRLFLASLVTNRQLATVDRRDQHLPDPPALPPTNRKDGGTIFSRDLCEHMAGVPRPSDHLAVYFLLRPRLRCGARRGSKKGRVAAL